MPTIARLPSVSDIQTAYGEAIRGQRDRYASTRTGGGFDRAGGPNALLLATQAQRDRWLFRQCFDNTASGEALDDRIEYQYGVPRTKATRGQGSAILERAPGGLGGTIWTGTRIEALAANSVPREYRVAQDTQVALGAVSVLVPVEAARTGVGVAINTGARLRLTDSVFDPTFRPVSLICGDGQEEESPGAYRARAKHARLSRRVGYQQAIEDACEAAGAAYVVALPADTFGPAKDRGLNYVYVADGGFSTPPSLLKACLFAIESKRIGGCDTQVLGMAPMLLKLRVRTRLVDQPSKIDLEPLRENIGAALLDAFNARRTFWTFRLAALAGAVQRTSPFIQFVTVATTPDDGLTWDEAGDPAVGFPSVLPRYFLAPSSVRLSFLGPE
jgi:hypothetical protein